MYIFRIHLEELNINANKSKTDLYDLMMTPAYKRKIGDNLTIENIDNDEPSILKRDIATSSTSSKNGELNKAEGGGDSKVSTPKNIDKSEGVKI